MTRNASDEINNKLTRQELLHLAQHYSEYVMEFPETHDEGSYPVCLEEFYINEYQDILEGYEKFTEKMVL